MRNGRSSAAAGSGTPVKYSQCTLPSGQSRAALLRCRHQRRRPTNIEVSSRTRLPQGRPDVETLRRIAAIVVEVQSPLGGERSNSLRNAVLSGERVQ